MVLSHTLVLEARSGSSKPLGSSLMGLQFWHGIPFLFTIPIADQIPFTALPLFFVRPHHHGHLASFQSG